MPQEIGSKGRADYLVGVGLVEVKKLEILSSDEVEGGVFVPNFIDEFVLPEAG